jgi:hypothetical protein
VLRLDGTLAAAADGTDLGSLAALKYLSMRGTNVTVGSLPQLATARSILLYDLRDNCPNLKDEHVGPLRQASHRPRVFANKSCEVVAGWPGAAGYVFRIPSVVSPVNPYAQTPPGMGRPTPAGSVGMGTPTPTQNVGMGTATPTVSVGMGTATPTANVGMGTATPTQNVGIGTATPTQNVGMGTATPTTGTTTPAAAPRPATTPGVTPTVPGKTGGGSGKP